MNTSKIYNKNKKKLILIILILVLALAAALLFGFFYYNQNKAPVISTPPTQEQIEQQAEEDSDLKDAFLDAQKDGDEGKQVEVPKDKSSIEINPETRSDDVILVIKLKEQGYSQGVCKLDINNGNATFKQTADIIYQPEYSTCAGFSVPITELGKGAWNITLSVTPIGGATLEKNISYKVN